MRTAAPSRVASLLLLIACALLVRALVPVGWMPATDGSGMLTLCSGRTISVAQAAAAMGGAPAQHDPAAPKVEQPCVFAGVVPVDDVPAPLEHAALRPSPATLILPRALRDVVAGRGLPAPPPPSTGPPILA